MARDHRTRPIYESSAILGVHGGLSPDMLPNGQIAQGVNISIRGGFVSSRPRFRALAQVKTEDKFQGAGVYSLASGDTVIFGLGSRVMELDPGTGETKELAKFQGDAGPHYHAQADRYFIVQNGEDPPVFMERGKFVRQANPQGQGVRELPVGTLMTYAHGRVFVVPRNLYDQNGEVLPDEDGRAYWMAGDILLPLSPENVLKVTEDEYWNEGGATSLPFEAGNITGLSVLQNAQGSGSGLGSLVAFGRTGVSAYVVAANREDWKNLDFSQVLFTGAGTESPKSLVPINDDLFFRGTDGIRSLRFTAQQNQGGSWSIRPVSYEVSHRLKLDAPEDLKEVTMSFADNRVLLPSAGRSAPGYNGLISLDTLVASSMTRGSSPAYDDLWTCAPVAATLSCRIEGRREHLVVFRYNGSYVFAVPSDDDTEDFTGAPPLSRMYTRAYGSQSADMLSLQHLDVIFRNIRGPFVARAYYRTDFYDRWTPFHGIQELDGPQRRHVRFSAPVDGCREDGSPPNVGHSVQICVQWRGVATLERWGPSLNPESMDSSAAMPCSSTTTSLSLGLDEIMVTLDDVADTLEGVI